MIRRILSALAVPLAVLSAFALVAGVLTLLGAPNPLHHGGAVTALGSLALGPLMLKGLGVAGMVIIPWSPPRTRAELEALVNPDRANQPEVVPWQLYDTQSVATGNTGPFTFFVAQNNDKTLSNMEGPGQLPDPQYFEVFYVACDILQIPTLTDGTSVNAAAANVENILKTCRATFTLNIANKRYGPFSLTMAHSTGGATGFGYAEGATAAGATVAVVNNGIPGSGGFPFSGAVVIPPKNGFDVTVALGTATTLVSGPVNVRMSLVGNLYRRVL